jgi:hypothetical protein
MEVVGLALLLWEEALCLLPSAWARVGVVTQLPKTLVIIGG